jgi:flagellar biosynthesis protein FlhG
VSARRLGRNLADLTGLARMSPAAISSAADAPAVVPAEAPSARNGRARILCITSGKGGTGKSVLTSNLSTDLARRGKKVLAVDADLGLANLHLLMGVNPRRNLYHCLSANLSFREISERTTAGVCLVPGPSGVAELADLSARDLAFLIGELGRVGSSFDLVLVDTAAGIARMTTAFLYAAREVIVVTTPDLTAMTDAYATIKTTLRHNPSALTSVVVNRAPSARQGWEVFQTLDGIAGKFLGRRLCYLGYLPDDDTVRRSVAAKVPAVLLEPESAVALRVREISEILVPPERAAEDFPFMDDSPVQEGRSR